VDRYPGLDTRSRVYLIGGIAWAVTTLVQPKSRLHYPTIYPRHFDTLYNLAVRGDARNRLCDENPSKNDNPDIGKVCQTFTIDNLIAGLEILKTFSEEMNFSQKSVFFIRDSLYAWPLGYLKAKCKDDGTC
jgi:hypothetical protein